jgi:hypothetical protein
VVLVVVARGDLPQAEVLQHLDKVMRVAVHLVLVQRTMVVVVVAHLRLERPVLIVLPQVAMVRHQALLVLALPMREAVVVVITEALHFQIVLLVAQAVAVKVVHHLITQAMLAQLTQEAVVVAVLMMRLVLMGLAVLVALA